MNPAAETPPGAQWERTRLAWRRTVLAGAMVALLGVRQALLAGTPWIRAVGAALLMLLWLGALLTGHRRATAIDRGEVSPGPTPVVTAGLTCGVAGLALALVAAGFS